MFETYNHDDILDAYRSIGVEPGRVVYITGNFGRLGRYHINDKEELFKAHLTCLLELVGSQGTIVVPTHSWSLVRTNTVFDRHATPSETGPFSEYVRQQKSAIRQLHPYSSSTALGGGAGFLCQESSRHAYGPHTPFDRMVDQDALYISIGQSMEYSISLIHHLEFMMGVPYRYVKEFKHPCLVEDEITEELFYLYVTHHNCDIKRDQNKKILDHFKGLHVLRKSNLGRSFVEALSSREFYACTSTLMSRDLYVWLSEPPLSRPYQI
jgi:aminoglycoside 3-N-acetyltransferase